MCGLLLLGVLALVAGPATPARALSIAIDASPGLQANAAALAAFERAADQWETAFADPITVTIDAGLQSLAPSVIGQTSVVLLASGYDTLRNAMVADAADETDDGIVASLPTAAGFSTYLPSGFGLDGYLAGTKANLKALGFSGLDASFGVTDATITFNSDFSFDFDSGDGVGAGLTDFETVAAHELGHALGFISVVDEIDWLVSMGTTDDVSPYLLDLFRFDDASDPSNASEFASFPRSMIPGNGEVFDDVGFYELALSTGSYLGDGRQASHWKDDALIGAHLGVMDPTLSSGTSFDVAVTDLRALDVIGFDIAIPEPSTGALLGLGLMGIGLTRRRA